MNIKIRTAQKSDAAAIAKSMIISSRSGKKIGIFDLIFETSDDASLQRFLEQLVTTETKSYCHYSNFIIAQIEEKVVGTYEEKDIATEKWVFLANGISEYYKDNKKTAEFKWTISKDGEIHIERKSSIILIY
ncbi:MAG: hypothetical protein DSZ03_00565, partial [Sulfurimonas sp.]